jgi:hypothetical protein
LAGKAGATSGKFWTFFTSMNLKRRNLRSDQRACTDVDSLSFLKAQAKKKQVESGGDRKSGDYKSVSKKIDQPIIPVDQKAINKSHNSNRACQKATEKLNTNRQYVDDAKWLEEENPEEFEKIKTGDLKLVQVKREIKS